MTQKLTLASNLLLKISVLFVLQAIILLMISNYQTRPLPTNQDNTQNSSQEAAPKEKEKPKTISQSKKKSSSNK